MFHILIGKFLFIEICFLIFAALFLCIDGQMTIATLNLGTGKVFNEPVGIIGGSSGTTTTLYITDQTGANQVFKYQLSSSTLTVFAGIAQSGDPAPVTASNDGKTMQNYSIIILLMF